MYAILCVIEDPAKQQALSLILRSNGYISLSADSATEAISITTSCSIDLVVLDHDLEKINYFELVRALKAIRDVPIISIASQDSVAWNRESSDLLITYPVYPPELLRAVELFCSRKVPVASSHVA